MNNDLISREALRKQFDNYKYFYSSFEKMTVAEFLTIAHELIDNAPTVEKRPQGEWVVDEDNGILKYMKCPNCGKVAEWLDGGRQLLSNFCPNCGADLRGEEE